MSGSVGPAVVPQSPKTKQTYGDLKPCGIQAATPICPRALISLIVPSLVAISIKQNVLLCVINFACQPMTYFFLVNVIKFFCFAKLSKFLILFLFIMFFYDPYNCGRLSLITMTNQLYILTSLYVTFGRTLSQGALTTFFKFFFSQAANADCHRFQRVSHIGSCQGVGKYGRYMTFIYEI